MSTARLRIAHVVNEPFSPDGANGVQQVIWCLARSQADLGQSVAVFSRDDRETHVLGNDRESPPGHAKRVRKLRARSLRERLLARHFEPDLANDVLSWRPQIVHFHSVHIAKNVAMAAYLHRAGIPYCVTVHGGLFPAALHRRRLKKTIFNLLFERSYLNGALFIQAVSHHEITPIRQYGVKARIVMIPNGLPPQADVLPARPAALFETNPSLSGRRIFMFIGRLDPWQKGLDLLVEAFAQAGLGGAALVMVGPDWFGSREALSARAARLGISSAVVFTGPAFGQDRANFFASADVFVHTSRWEGLSLSVLAAAAARKPCLITRDADPLGELERAQGAFIVDTNVASIAAGLRHAATLPVAELQAMGYRAAQAVESRFRWSVIAATLVEEYRRPLEPSNEDALTGHI